VQCCDRATEGGSYHVKVSLARSAMWVQDFGSIDRSDYENEREKDDYPSKLVDVASPYGTITELAPAVQFEHSPQVEILPVRPSVQTNPSGGVNLIGCRSNLQLF
jgi:hypothetical protein